jgi:hypothetical protein
MSPTGSDTEGLGFSLRNAVLALLFLLVVRLGAGWARGIVEGNYVRGVLGLILALGPILYLLVLFKRAYF